MKTTFRRSRHNSQIHGHNNQKESDNHSSSFSTVVRDDKTDPGDENKHGRGQIKLQQERCRVAVQPDVYSGYWVVPPPVVDVNSVLLFNHCYSDLEQLEMSNHLLWATIRRDRKLKTFK